MKYTKITSHTMRSFVQMYNGYQMFRDEVISTTSIPKQVIVKFYNL